jgi:tRNA(Ile)-lysidine synthetase-like protein
VNKTITYLKTILNSQSIVVIGCSGGPDSMCLLHLLCELKKELNFKVIVAHMNHKQRIESDEEATFVKQFCLDNNCDFEYYELHTNIPSNFHSEARHIRYQFYDEVINKYHANFLMTAHHADDLMETILMRIGRGSTLKGYSGFDLITDKETYQQVHPLIFYTKSEIKKYMDDHNYDYRIDNTNYDDDFTRNRYRHTVLPFLKKENPLIHEKYYKFSETINEADAFINRCVIQEINKVYINNNLNLELFKEEDILIQKRIIEYILNSLYPDNLYLVTDANTKEIINMIYNNKPNISIKLPNNITLTKSYNKLCVANTSVINQQNIIFNDYFEDQDNIIKLVSETTDTSNYTIRLDSKELKLPLILRHRQNGDIMTIKNMTNSKKIKDILIDSKIPINIRNNMFILTDSDNNILWLPGLKKSKFDKDILKKYDIILKYIKKGD